MTLLDVSDASLSKICTCLTKTVRDRVRFGRTNYRIYQIAVLQGCFQVDVEQLEIVWEEEDKYLVLNFYTETCEERFDFEVQIAHPFIENMMSHTVEILKRLNSIADLTFTGFVVTEEMLLLLRDALLPLTTSSSFKLLTFNKCEFDCSSMQFFDTINYLKIKKLALTNVDLKSMRIASVHLGQLTSISVVSISKQYASEINDLLLQNWLYKPAHPAVNLYAVDTNITLNGLLKFIQRRTAIPVSKPADHSCRRYFELGNVKIDDSSMKELAIAQRIPALRWKILPSSSRNTIIYLVRTENYGLNYVFIIPTKAPRKITKQHARAKIEILRREVEEKLDLEAVYQVFRDKEIMDQIKTLADGIYPEWTDLKEDINILETMRNDLE